MTAEPEDPIFSDEARAELGAQALELSQPPETEEPASDETDEQTDDTSEPDDVISDDAGDAADSGDTKREPTESLKAAAEAAIAGDSKALAKALGLEDSALDTSSRKMRFVRSGIKEAKDLAKQTEEVRGQLVATFGDIREAKLRHEKGDVLGAVAAIEKVFGAEFTDIVSEVLELQSGVDGVENKAIRERETKLKAREDAFAASQRKIKESYDATAARKTAVGRVKASLKDHAYIHDDSDVEEVVSLVERAWNGKTYDLTIQEAADQLLAKANKRAERLGLKAAPKLPKPARRKIAALRGAAPKKKPEGRERLEDIFTDEDRARLGAEAARLSGGK